jgi:hypothetical protein
MSPITDDDLVLYHYRDGLDDDRIAQIAAALATSQTLRERYAAIEHAVAHFGQDEVAPAPDLGERLWRRLEPQLAEAGIVASTASSRAETNIPRQSIATRVRTWIDRTQPWPAFAVAAVLVVAIGLGFVVGRQSVSVSPPPVASVETESSAARVLDAYVAMNLRATERVLLTASNSNSASLLEGNRELAQSLVESNRLYALAAANAGNSRLAVFLRQLEPVLISLANQPGSATVQSSEDLRGFLDATDLLFQLRAIEARLDRNAEQRRDTNGDARI